MSGGGWSCPHEVNSQCGKVNNRPCEPGMKGCELHGRYAFFNDEKNERLRQKQARSKAPDQGAETGDPSPALPNSPQE